MQVLVENGAVQQLALETAAQEKSAATSQQTADQWQIQIDARSNMRHAKLLVVKKGREQQIVQMAAVRREIDDFTAILKAFHRLKMINPDVVVQARP